MPKDIYTPRQLPREQPDRCELCPLVGIIPKDERLMFCHRLIYHGRAVCQARKPACEICTLFDLCSLQKGKTKV